MTTDTAINVSIPIAAFLIMFAIGLGLTSNDFRSALRSPKALVVGIAMVPRMELALAIVTAGLLAGKVGAGMYSSFVIVVLVTLAAAPWMIERAYSFERKKHL